MKSVFEDCRRSEGANVPVDVGRGHDGGLGGQGDGGRGGYETRRRGENSVGNVVLLLSSALCSYIIRMSTYNSSREATSSGRIKHAESDS